MTTNSSAPRANNPRALGPLSAPARKRVYYLLMTLLLSAFALLMLTPFIWMLSSSFKLQKDVMSIPIHWVPKQATLDNYAKVLHLGVFSAGKDYHFFSAYWNSITIAAINTATSVITSAMAGYAFAKLRFRGAKIVFIIYLAQMMVPSQLTLIPRFMMFAQWNLVNTKMPIILPKIISVSSTFLMRQAFISIPNDLRESATIDGAGEYRIWLKIMLPIAAPTLGALCTVQFLDSWNSYLDPLVFLSNWRLHTLPIALNQFVGEEGTQYNLVTAACSLTVIPVFLVFLSGQRFFIKGLVTGAVKG